MAYAAPMNDIGVMAEVVVGELLQPFQLGVEGSAAGEAGVEGGCLGVHRGLSEVIDDMHMNALFDQEAKLFLADLSLWRQNGDSDTLEARMTVGG